MEQFAIEILQDVKKSTALIIVMSLFAGYTLASTIMAYPTRTLEVAVHIATTVMFIVAGFIVRYMVLDDLKETTSK